MNAQPSNLVPLHDGDQRALASPHRALPWWMLAGICVLWLGLFSLTPGLLDNGVGHLFTDDITTSVVVETVLALLLSVVLVLVHPRFNRDLFARSWSTWLYALPLVSVIALPFHYSLPRPLIVYMIWMTVSVFWQDYLTFGLLQSYLRERLPTWATVTIVTIVFWLAHALFIPGRFTPANVIPSLAILALALVLSLLRARLKTIHLILALHLSFYFLFA